MAKYLVIVESPTKAKTISSILGNDFEVVSSMGHVVDLATSSLSIDIDNAFAPTYRVITGKEKTMAMLKKKAKNKEKIYLATDHDREGEAISWHIKDQLSLPQEKISRVVFHEITKDAIAQAFKEGGKLDLHKVDAQRARRILDRIVGYFISPLLWKKIVRGLSAGRVQSVALKFIVEKEQQIQKFIPTTTYEIEGDFKAKAGSLKAKLIKYHSKKAVFATKDEAKKAVTKLKKDSFSVYDIKKRQSKRTPPPPYTTSLLQQDAFNKLKYSSKRTMIIAQSLYEGVEVNGEMLGLITYMRTDSFHIADKAKQETQSFVLENFGKEYCAAKEYKYKERKSAQLAHEAIRPTDVRNTPSRMAQYLKPEEYKLYELIWKRFVSCFMKEAIVESIRIMIGDAKTYFETQVQRFIFDGFLKLMGKENDKEVPAVAVGEALLLDKIKVNEKTTKPPARFNDASLVKLLEEKGIGRPSTYAPTISTLIFRNYVRREKRSLKPTDLGIKVCEFLVQSFEGIMDENFTAQIEEKLDGIEEGDVDSQEVLRSFYPAFKQQVDSIGKNIKKHVELIERTCPKCGRQLAIKWSRRGKFLSCSGYPQCKYAESITTDVVCPLCKIGKLIERRNKRGQFFFGCSGFPECRFTSRTLPSESKEESSE